MVSSVWICLVVSTSVLPTLPISLAISTQARMHCSPPASCLDCHTLQLCPPHSTSWQNVTTINCSQTSLPFCDDSTGSCSATPSSSCVPKDTFICLSDGYFPDPVDCRTFHLCVDLVPTSYQCDPILPSYYIYDVVLHRCVQSATCGFNCKGKSGVKVPHPVDKNLYAICYNGSVTYMDRCMGNYQLDEVTQACQPVCKVEGFLVDLDNCNMFFRCISQNGGYLKKHEQCPEGKGFNPITFRCEEDVQGCEVPATTTEPPTTPSTFM